MPKKEKYRRWSQTEVDYLLANYDELTARAIADALNRTPEAVWDQANKQGMRKYARVTTRDTEGPWLCGSCKKVKIKENFPNRDSSLCNDCKEAA